MPMTQDELLDRIDSVMNFGEPEEAAAVAATVLRGLADRGREVREAMKALPEEQGITGWQLEEAIAALEELEPDA